MKTYYNNEAVKQDIHDKILMINDDIEIAFDGFSIDADIRCKNIYSKGCLRNINAWDINAQNINAGDINAGDINARNITARNITALDINAGDIDALNITAPDINAGDIDALNINADDINAWDIDAWDINAQNINAGDIFYNAVCFAYQNIKCKSIKGFLKGARHFCIGGEIIIEEEIEELTMEEVCERLGKQIKIKK